MLDDARRSPMRWRWRLCSKLGAIANACQAPRLSHGATILRQCSIGRRSIAPGATIPAPSSPSVLVRGDPSFDPRHPAADRKTTSLVAAPVVTDHAESKIVGKIFPLETFGESSIWPSSIAARRKLNRALGGCW
jgi:hypothetical protein